MVELPTIRSVMLAKVAKSEEMNELVLVLLSTARLVMYPLVVVELPTMRSVMLARVATRDEMNELVEVELVEVRLAKLPLVAVNDVVKKFVIVPVEA